MKRLYQLILYIFLFCKPGKAQETVYPAKDFKGLLFITHGTIHVGNGQVIADGTIANQPG